MENKNQSFTHKVGDAIERAGEKISDMGATKIGNRISQTGDRIEHSQDEKTIDTTKNTDY
jgi:hypothetical protein